MGQGGVGWGWGALEVAHANTTQWDCSTTIARVPNAMLDMPWENVCLIAP